VPRLPPVIDGIGDYSLLLAKRLSELHGIQTRFVVCDPEWKGPQTIDGFSITTLKAKDKNALAEAIDRSSVGLSDIVPVLIHFAPYAYSSRGCPVWILNALQDRDKRNSQILLTMYHELDAVTRIPWKSSFWLAPVQRQIIRRLAVISAFALTSAARYKDRLGNWGIKDVALTPVFSNVGEPSINLPVEGRERQMIVFGRPPQREICYTLGKLQLQHACTAAKATRVVDIGAPMSFDGKEVCGIPIVRLGRLPATEISQLMSSSVASFLYYPQTLLTKSSVYAAICAHGAIPFVGSGPMDQAKVKDLVDGLDFITVSKLGVSFQQDNLQTLSDQIFRRYHERSSLNAANVLQGLLSRLPAKEH